MATTSIKAITTIKARQKFAKAHAEGTPVPKITQIGFGTGGVNEDGSVKLPTADLVSVPNEFIKKPIEKTEVIDGGLTVLYTCGIRATESNVVNQPWSSLGLYDAEGDLIAIKNFTVKNIDEDTKVEVTWNEKF